MAYKRPISIALLGATGFTGRLVAQHLMRRRTQLERDARPVIALGGRNAEKLHALQAELGQADIQLIQADVNDPKSLLHLAQQCEVLISTVGPYCKFGSAVVEACLEARTDYCDLTGELPWVHQIIERHHQEAKEQGTRIVHACGFDSIPSELGVYQLQQEALSRFGKACQSVEMTVLGAKGSFSGGTLASLIEVMKAAKSNSSLRNLLLDPYALTAREERGECLKVDLIPAPRFELEFLQWSGPFAMGSYNIPMLYRSLALATWPWGRDFCYSERQLTGKNAKGRLAALTLQWLMSQSLSAKPWILYPMQALALSRPGGTGPNEEDRKAGYYKIRFHGQTADGQSLTSEWRGQQDPGYGSTAMMLGEAALALWMSRDQGRPGGILSPGFALADILMTALLEHAEIRYTFLSE